MICLSVVAQVRLRSGSMDLLGSDSKSHLCLRTPCRPFPNSGSIRQRELLVQSGEPALSPVV